MHQPFHLSLLLEMPFDSGSNFHYFYSNQPHENRTPQRHQEHGFKREASRKPRSCKAGTRSQQKSEGKKRGKDTGGPMEKNSQLNSRLIHPARLDHSRLRQRQRPRAPRQSPAQSEHHAPPNTTRENANRGVNANRAALAPNNRKARVAGRRSNLQARRKASTHDPAPPTRGPAYRRLIVRRLPERATSRRAHADVRDIRITALARVNEHGVHASASTTGNELEKSNTGSTAPENWAVQVRDRVHARTQTASSQNKEQAEHHSSMPASNAIHRAAGSMLRNEGQRVRVKMITEWNRTTCAHRIRLRWISTRRKRQTSRGYTARAGLNPMHKTALYPLLRPSSFCPEMNLTVFLKLAGNRSQQSESEGEKVEVKELMAKWKLIQTRPHPNIRIPPAKKSNGVVNANRHGARTEQRVGCADPRGALPAKLGSRKEVYVGRVSRQVTGT
ncbi:hypothetical protein B0H17DRAFT_1147258 [Mycena rosella]|uniref:Uncharacterized protein n=1 Tax=Mycena rosella TaxID=1033263 RepID=A0AAD7CM40_MYCRO|nr:hypothetical protein B0H17DRAFT_1147258 [Mycena rosella]